MKAIWGGDYCMEDKLLKYMLFAMAVTLTIWLIVASILVIGWLIRVIP